MSMFDSDHDDPESLIADAAFLLPQLGPALARLRVSIREPRPGDPSTAFVSEHGDVVLTTDVPTEDRQFILLHECMHMVTHYFASAQGIADEDLPRWNRASDRWINACLKDILAGSTTNVPGDALLPKQEQWTWTIEQLFEAEARQRGDAERGRGGKGAGKLKAGQGCGMPKGTVKGDPGDEGNGDGQGGGTDVVDEMAARQIAAGIGSVLGRFADLIVTPPPRALRRDILREAVASASGHGRPRSTFARLGRRSNPTTPRPGKSRRQPKVVVVVDISGSMYPDLPEIVAEAEDLANIATVHLILHDTEVLYSGKVKKAELRKAIRQGGGTSFGPALAEAAKVATTGMMGAAVVHFTDGYCCDPWPAAVVPCSYVGMTADSRAEPPGNWRVRRLKGAKDRAP